MRGSCANAPAGIAAPTFMLQAFIADWTVAHRAYVEYDVAAHIGECIYACMCIHIYVYMYIYIISSLAQCVSFYAGVGISASVVWSEYDTNVAVYVRISYPTIKVIVNRVVLILCVR